VLGVRRLQALALRPGLIVGILVLVASVAVSPAAAQDPVAEIQDLLDRRAEAMMAGDEATYLATIDRGDAAFVERQRNGFRGFQQIGLSSYRLDLTTRYWPELTSAREVEEHGEAAEPHLFHVEERYRLRGYDRQPALEDLFLTFVRRGDGWVIASDTDLDDLTLYSGRKLWENGTIFTEETEHFLYVSHPDVASASDEVLRMAERAIDAVNARWPLSWPEKVVILAPSSTEELRRIIQATFDLDVFVAFAYSGVDRARNWDLVGHRIILNWPNFSRFPESTQESILVHELLHVATREYNGPAVATWIDEGVAELVSQDVDEFYLSQAVAGGAWDRRLPRDFEFVAGEDDDILEAYEESASGIRYANQRFGIDEVTEFYRLLGRVRSAVGTSKYHVGRAMDAAWDVPFDMFEDRWADWVEQTV
jgi:hypothetical protein